jgi:metal-responsive CopG/Arc/MetJ family transcriptional regulator
MAVREGKEQVTATIEERYVSALDYIREKDNRSRSYVIRLAIIEYLEKRRVVIEPNAEQRT